MQEEWDRFEEWERMVPPPGGSVIAPPSRSQSDGACAHPRLFGVPGGSGNSYTLVCDSCTKRLVIRYGAFIGGGDTKEFCLAAMFKETFGDAWGNKAVQQCRCSACKAKRYEV